MPIRNMLNEKKYKKEFKMFQKTTSLLIAISLMSLISGCGSFYAGRLPSNYIEDYANFIKLKDITVAVKFYNCDEAKETFSCNMDKKGIHPVFIVIDNKSNVTYGFRKENIDSRYIYAVKAARSCFLSKMKYGGIWPPLHIRVSKINENMKNDYLSKEIADVSVEPGNSLSGVIFLKSIKSGEKLNIPLINRNDGTRLIFEFQKFFL